MLGQIKSFNDQLYANNVDFNFTDSYIALKYMDLKNLQLTNQWIQVVESAGLLKMDFLGLKTLSLIKDTIKLVKYIHNKDIDIESIPLDDKKTYELFQRGDT